MSLTSEQSTTLQKSSSTSTNSSSKNLNEHYSENTCVVCFKTVEIFSIGECDHPVCFECSTRMRVLCRQNECPICRQDLQKVIFTTEILPYRQLETKNRTGLYDKKYRICFSSTQLQKEFYRLLENPCPKCTTAGNFNSFDTLKDHVRREHELFYCELCTENLNIFSFERRCYTRQELGLHRRKGDPDNTSHRGHPLCKYCDCRYLDRDELFRHLRREHFYCHFCDADGSNQFYADYESMRDHFKSEHYLCEEGDCAQEKFTAVFRTDIDLKAHKATIHGRNLGKVAAKQARTLEFEFTLAPRNRNQNQNSGGESSRGSMRIRNDPQMEFEIEDQSAGFVQAPQRVIDHQNEEEFPSLGGGIGGGGAAALAMNMRPNLSIRAKAFGNSNLARTSENFPALGGGGNSALEPGSSISYVQSKNTASSLLKNHQKSTGGGSGVGGMIIHVSNRPKSTPVAPSTSAPSKREVPAVKSHDFPALPGSQKARFADLDDNYTPLPSGTMSAVAAKHKQLLLDGFTPVSSNVDTKFNLIKSDGVPASPVKSKPINPPKLNSQDNFPALSAPSASSVTSLPIKWTIPRQKVEPKKSKVAPAPLLTNSFPVENGYKKSTGNDMKPDTTSSVSSTSKKEKKNQIPKNGNAPITTTTSTTANNNNNNRNNSNTKSATKENNNSLNSNNKKVNTMNNLNVDVDRKTATSKSDKNLDDFPALGTTTTTPPPGFEMKTKAPPPGFNKVTVNSIARPQNNLTFTTSTGESFNILPSHKYIPPPNSSKRNQVLVTVFQQAINTGVMEEFRRISQLFREGNYNTLPYYEHCQSALGERFDEIFPELLALLPDISKQQELFLVHSQHLKVAKSKKNRSSKIPKLEVCSTCKQVLVSNDLLAHLQNHSLENNFPSLNNRQKTPSQSATVLSSGGSSKK